MKKRLISSFLAVALLLSLVVVPVWAEPVSDNVTDPSEKCSCGCDTVISQIQWRPYNVNAGEKLSPGHYYLPDDYVQTGAQQTIMAGDHVVLDLRGHTLTTAYSGRLFLIYGYLYVLDTVGGGTLMSKTTGSGFGGVLMVSVYEVNSSLLELRSGTVTMDPEGNNSLRGGLISLGQHSTFRMYDGLLTGGRTHVSGTSATQGGAIAGTTVTSTIEILGGTIMDCSSVTDGGSIYNIGTTILKNCKIWGGTAQRDGGNIYQSGGSLTMENCDIAYGTANGNGGGNIYVTGSAVFTDNGSTIRDGFTVGGTGNGGGNILFGAGTHTLNGTTIKGGVSRKYGANILNWAATTTRLIDCNIDGDVRWAGTGLSLEGKTKIGLRGNGLNLVGSSAGSIISASKLTDGAEIFVSARWGEFTNDDANLDYFKPALRTVLTKEEDGKLSGSFAADGEQGGYCPHCYDPENPQKVTWQGYNVKSNGDAISQSGHYYVNGTVNARVNIAAGMDIALDTNGYALTSTHRCFVVGEAATLSLLDFNGAGSVTGVGGNGWNGGVIWGEKAYNLNIYCGSYIYSSKADAHVANGGVIYAPAGSNVKIYGGCLDGSSYNKTGTSNYGGVLRIAKGTASFTMSAGRIVGGTAFRGGSVCFGTGNTVTITGGVITGGTATNGGGNIRSYGTETTGTTQVTMRDCAVVGGTVIGDSTLTEDKTFAGGNIQFAYHNAQMDRCYVVGGNITMNGGYGGNINSGMGTLQVKDSIIANGRAPKGGNLYAGAVTSYITVTDSLIFGGEAFVPASSTSSTEGYGGNIFINNGVITINGGLLLGGKAGRVGGNIYNNAGNNTVGNKLILQDGIQQPLIAAGTATTGGNLYLSGVSELKSVRIAGGDATTGADVYLYNGAKMALTLGGDLSGTIHMATAAALLGEGTYGQPITGVTTENFGAQIVMEKIAGQPKALAQDGQLVVAGTSVVDKNGEETWFSDNSAAVEACGKDAYVKLYTANDLELTKDLTVDLNGQTVAVSGNYTLSGMDNTGDGYTEPAGKAIGAANVAPVTYAPNGNLYVPVTEGEDVTFHRLGMAMTDIVLRPDDAGIYYQAAWSCDSVLKAMIAEYGIVASLAGMPDANFRNDAACEAASFTGAIENGTKQCGVLIKDIMQNDNEAERNRKNGEMPIFATAYVTLTDGTTIVSDSTGVEDDVQFSLFDFMSYLDTRISTDPANYRKFEKRVREFYAAWENKGMGKWVFNRVKAPVDPTTDNEFNVLFVASSACYYFVEELQALLTEAGYENARVCNLYYSGCRLEWHYNWWKNNEENYQFFVTDDTGRHKTDGVGLEYCLSQYNWDAIILIEGTSYMRVYSENAQAHFEKTKGYVKALTDYFQSEFPQAQHCWQLPWSYQIGWDGNGFKVTSVADQKADLQRYTEYAQLLCSNYNMTLVNCGDAWEVYRDLANSDPNDDIVDDLCARIGKAIGDDPNAGDNSHDGDIGGGQLLNACVWFEWLTGKDCRELTYVPVYKSGTTVVPNRYDADIIKECAHQAVQALMQAN